MEMRKRALAHGQTFRNSGPKQRKRRSKTPFYGQGQNGASTNGAGEHSTGANCDRPGEQQQQEQVGKTKTDHGAADWPGPDRPDTGAKHCPRQGSYTEEVKHPCIEALSRPVMRHRNNDEEKKCQADCRYRIKQLRKAELKSRFPRFCHAAILYVKLADKKSDPVLAARNLSREAAAADRRIFVACLLSPLRG
jgi:hypothetical protein